ncbi:MAG: LamG-like jellyroll fold domain-containing protein [Bacteroidota bacterium]
MKTLIICCSILCSTLPLIGQLSLQDSLIAWYPFDGDAQDYSGNANHGTINGASLTTDRFGNPNSAYQFNGSSNFISFTNQQNFRPDFPITISAWVKIDDYGNNVIFNNDFTFGEHRGFWLNIVNGNLYISYGNGGAADPLGRRSIGGNTLLQLNQWYHVTGIVRNTTDMELYLNGKRECGTYSGIADSLVYSTNAGISGRGTNLNSYYRGSIDEIRFYNRVLDKSEIRILADFPPQDTTFCQGDSLQLDAGYGSLISWSPTSDLSCTTCPNPIAFPNQPTLYRAITENTAGCPDTVDISIITKACPSGPCDTIDIDINFEIVVNGASIQLVDSSSIPSNAQLDLSMGDNSFWNLVPGDTINHTYLNNGTYVLCMEAVLALGETIICGDTLCDTVQISGITRLDKEWEASFSLYPNPSEGLIRVEFPDVPGQNSQLVLLDMRGAILKEWQLDLRTEYELDLRGFPAGYYQLQMRDHSQRYQAVKLILE